MIKHFSYFLMTAELKCKKYCMVKNLLSVKIKDLTAKDWAISDGHLLVVVVNNLDITGFIVGA